MILFKTFDKSIHIYYTHRKQKSTSMSAKEILQKSLNVSRETLVDLELFAEILIKWNNSINLVGKNTIEDLWKRHILDSAQLVQYINLEEKILDIGSGAGFPGAIVAIINKNKTILVEKNKKKCAFLNEIKTKITLHIDIKNETIEKTNTNNIDIITSRALASVTKMLELSERFDSKVILLKGVGYERELEEAKNCGWNFNIEIKKSMTNAQGAVLIFSNIHKNHDKN